jgi:transcriptional regulator with XRE-family HTH domain
MSKIGKNIKKIRTVKKLSQAAFAEIFNLARPSVGAYEEGRAEPRIDTLIQIASHFGLSVDTLLRKDLTINELVRFDSLKKREPDQKTPPQRPVKKTRQNLNTKYIPTPKYLDYIRNFKNADFVDSLPAYHFPYISSTGARAFEISDNAMMFDNAGILTGDIVICEKRIANISGLHLEHLYVLVLKDNILVRRLKEKSKKLKLAPDNPDWQNLFLFFDDMQEIWEINRILTSNMLPPIQVNKRISLLEDQLNWITDELVSIKQRLSRKG